MKAVRDEDRTIIRETSQSGYTAEAFLPDGSKIRMDSMKPSDLAEVVRIEQDSFSQPWSENGFRSALEGEDSLYLAVRLAESGELAGYCGFLQSFDTADILNVAVRRDMRGNGIGYAMLQRLMELGRKRGIFNFTLEVRKSNLAAVRLYEKLGFVSAGIRRNFYEKPAEDAVIMWTHPGAFLSDSQ